MRECPVCAELIQDKAKKCRFCGELFSKKEEDTSNTPIKKQGSFAHYKWQFVYFLCSFLMLGQIGKILEQGSGEDNFSLAGGTMGIFAIFTWVFLVSYKNNIETEKKKRPLIWGILAIGVIGYFITEIVFGIKTKGSLAMMIGALFASPIIATTVVKTYLGDYINSQANFSSFFKRFLKVLIFIGIILGFGILGYLQISR